MKITVDSGRALRPWVFNTYEVDISSLSPGSILNILWYGGGSGSADGLELADIDFVAETVPEPASTAPLLSLLFAFSLLHRRRDQV